jgi:serine/threonine protein kinase
MPIALTFTAGAGVRNYDVREGQQIVVGRSRKADLYVNSPRLSRLHCAVRRSNSRFTLEDLGSANGTFLNGQRVKQAFLRPGDIVQVGGVAIRIDFDPNASPDMSLRCDRCGMTTSMARSAEGSVFHVGKQFLCPDCALIQQTEDLSQSEQQLVEMLREEGFAVEGKTPLSTPILPVFKARRLDLDTVVAIKALPLVAGISPKKIKRFQSEARAAAKVRHSSVLEIHDIRQASNALYIIMEYVEGELLLDVVESRGPLSVQAALRVGLHVARALQKAHDQGIVHRDLKPGGILLTQDGRPKVADFGLAKDMWAITSHLTGPEETLGTVRYMPPEQVKNARQADHRSDLYALGSTLFHLLTGAPPYAKKNELELMSQVLSGTLQPFDPSQADLPPGLGTILRNCMHPDPEQRYQSAAELEADIGRFVVELMGLKGFTSDPELLLSMPAGGVEESTWQAIPAPKPGGMSGFFESDELTEFLRMLGHNERTGMVTIHSQQLSGHLALLKGRLRAAITNTGTRGKRASTELLSLSSGQFEFVPELSERFRPEIDVDLESVLLDAARFKDETGRYRG